MFKYVPIIYTLVNRMYRYPSHPISDNVIISSGVYQKNQLGRVLFYLGTQSPIEVFKINL